MRRRGVCSGDGMGYGRHSYQEKPERHTGILGKSSEVVGAYGALLVAQQQPFWQNASPHRRSYHDQPNGLDQSFVFMKGFTGPACYRRGGLVS